jgi:hypothetical protein
MNWKEYDEIYLTPKHEAEDDARRIKEREELDNYKGELNEN